MTEIESVRQSTIITNTNGELDRNNKTVDHHLNGHKHDDDLIAKSGIDSSATVLSTSTAVTAVNNDTSKTATLSPRAGTVNSDKVLIHAYPRSPLIPHLSPFVLKLETWLRMNGIPYEMTDQQPQNSKTSKMPWIEYRGQQLYDSQLIIENLSERDGGRYELDANLNVKDRAVSRAFQKMIDEYTAWSLSVWRFSRDPECRVLSAAAMPNFGPKFLPGILTKSMAKRRVENYAYAQGIGRLEDSVFQDTIKKDFKAVSDFMGTHDYLFGSEPHSVDASIFGLTSQYLWFDTTSPFHTFIKESTPNLVEHAERIKAKYFSDWNELLIKAAPQNAGKSSSIKASNADMTPSSSGVVAATTLKKEKTPKKTKKNQNTNEVTTASAASPAVVVDAGATGDAGRLNYVHHTDNEAIINTASPAFVDHTVTTAVTTNTTKTETIWDASKLPPSEMPPHVVKDSRLHADLNAANVSLQNGNAYNSAEHGDVSINAAR